MSRTNHAINITRWLLVCLVLAAAGCSGSAETATAPPEDEVHDPDVARTDESTEARPRDAAPVNPSVDAETIESLAPDALEDSHVTELDAPMERMELPPMHADEAAPMVPWTPRSIEPPETEGMSPFSASPKLQPDVAQPRAMRSQAIQPQAMRSEAMRSEAMQPQAMQPQAMQPQAMQHRSMDRAAASPEVAVTESPLSPIDPETGAHQVEVFYATDRRPLVETVGRIRLQLFAGVMVAAIFTILLGGATVLLRRRVVLGALTVVAALFTAVLFHAANLKSQKAERFAENEDRVYGSDRHETADGYRLELGVAQVSIPPDHRVGKLESPSILRLEFRETAEKHVVLERVILKSDDDFYDELGMRIQQSPGEQAFVFVHGYNVMFDDAVKRTAQIAHDLRFAGAPICYSWPSKGGLAEYTRDEANVTWTVIHLENFLNDVVHRTGARTVHLVAHSMGNRAMLQALERIALQQAAPEPVFGQLVLAAPDVDTAEFRDRYAPAVTRIARHVTLYASSNDQALLASTKVHGHTRAGLSGGLMTVVRGVDTIDVSPIDTSLIGHSYYGDNPLMIRDMRALVELSEPASSRPWLEQIANTPELVYWAFREGFEASPVNVGRQLTLPQR